MLPTKTERIRGHALQRIRDRILKRDPLCVMCLAKGRVTESVEIDHIVPVMHGGMEEDSNRQGLCKDCHREKTNRDLGYKPKHGVNQDGTPRDPDHHWNR